MPRSPRTRRLSLAVLVVALTTLGCERGESAPAEMRAAVEPHLVDFERFDRWARRLDLSGTALSSEAARETAFAPLRGDGRILAAWLERRGPDPASLSNPEDAPALPADGWVVVHVDALEGVDTRRWRLREGDEDHAVLLIRRTRGAPGEARLVVSLAFRDDGP